MDLLLIYRARLGNISNIHDFLQHREHCDHLKALFILSLSFLKTVD